MSLWNSYIFEGTIMEENTNFIKLTHKITRKKQNIINIYASNKLLERRKL